MRWICNKGKLSTTGKSKYNNVSGIKNTECELTKLKKLNDVHKLKADTFYDRKRKAKIESRKQIDMEAICKDFSKKLPLPNIQTNKVGKRQLSMFSNNMHVLSGSKSVVFVYLKNIGKKGSDDVCSMLY